MTDIGYVTDLILTNSNGTTTKLSVAPALQPVKIESCCVILVSPDNERYVFPQKSFAALSCGALRPSGYAKIRNTHNLTARLGASRRSGGTNPKDQRDLLTIHSCQSDLTHLGTIFRNWGPYE